MTGDLAPFYMHISNSWGESVNDPHSTQWAAAAGSLLDVPMDSVEPVEQGASSTQEGLAFAPCDIIQSSEGDWPGLSVT